MAFTCSYGAMSPGEPQNCIQILFGVMRSYPEQEITNRWIQEDENQTHSVLLELR